jgi:hypothetical protein
MVVGMVTIEQVCAIDSAHVINHTGPASSVRMIWSVRGNIKDYTIDNSPTIALRIMLCNFLHGNRVSGGGEERYYYPHRQK